MALWFTGTQIPSILLFHTPQHLTAQNSCLFPVIIFTFRGKGEEALPLCKDLSQELHVVFYFSPLGQDGDTWPYLTVRG